MKNEAVNFWKFYNEDYPLNVMVIGKTECDGDYYVNRKNSRIMAFEYMIYGSETLNINSKTYHPQKNSAVLLTKGSQHEYYCGKNEKAEKEWVVFDGALAESLIKMYLPDNEYCFENCNLLPYFREIDRIKKNCANNYEALTDEFSVILHRMIIQIRNSISNNKTTLAEQIRKYLDANIEKKVTMDELSSVFSYSKNQLTRIFKEAYGLTPYHYYLERKIDVAKLYLSNTRKPVSEISRILVFSDQNYFSSEFKRITSLSPSEYRKKMN